MFGQNKPLFGSTGTSPFGQTSTFGGSNNIFGGGTMQQPQPAQTMFGGNSISGTTAFGSLGQPAQASGSAMAFNPPLSTDTVQRSGQTSTINTKHMCYTAMKEYQDKSLEELRLEDYLANRKGPESKSNSSIFGGGGLATATNTFGSPAASTQPSSIFGGTAATSTAGIFGGGTQQQPANAGGLFGAKPLFGSTTQQASPNVNLFGGAAGTSNTFGTTGTAGTTNTAFGGFGQQNTAQNNASSLFGSKPLFGSPAPAIGGPLVGSAGIFGSNQPQQQQAGGIFGQTNSVFGQTNTNTLGATTGQASTGGLFGNSSTLNAQQKPTGFLFGQTQPQQAQTSPFGQANTAAGGIFGAKPATLGANTTGGGLFGNTAATGTQGSIFGSPSTAAVKPGGFSFGSTAPAGTSTGQLGSGFAFGSQVTNTQGAGTLFGSTAASMAQNKPFFGSIATTSAPTVGGFSFGGTTTNTNAAGSLFGQTASPSKPTGTIFGQSASPAGGLFGSTTGTAGAATGSIFGSSTGTNPAAGTLFGTSASSFNKPFGSNTFGTGAATGFGSPGSTFGTTGAFGAGATNTGTGSLFGSTANAFGSFGATQTAASSFGAGLSAGFQAASNPAVNSAADQLAQSVRAQQHVLNLVRSMPYGSLYKHLNITGGEANGSPLQQQQQQSGSPVDVNTASTKHVVNTLVERNRNSNSLLGSGLRSQSQRILPVDRIKLFSGLEDEESPLGKSNDSFLFSSPKSPSNASSGNSSMFFVKKDDWKRLTLPDSLRKSIIERALSSGSPANNTQQLQENHNEVRSPPISIPAAAGDNTSSVAAARLSNPLDSNRQPVGLSPNSPGQKSSRNRAEVKLTKPGYYMLPSMDSLDEYINAQGRCLVDDLVIGRKGYGHILFPGHVDITAVNLDEIVHIKRGEVSIYPDDEAKPPIGYGLNRRAEITLDGLWPKDRSTRELIAQPDVDTAARFSERLEKATTRMDANFIEYRAETGSWVFEVKHFSKYRYDDSDEEQGPPVPVQPPAAAPLVKNAPQPPVPSYLTQAKLQLFSQPTTHLFDDEDLDHGQILEDEDMPVEDDVKIFSMSKKSYATRMFFRDEMGDNGIGEDIDEEDVLEESRESISASELSVLNISGDVKFTLRPLPTLQAYEGQPVKQLAREPLALMKIPVHLKELVLDQGFEFNYALVTGHQPECDIKLETRLRLESQFRGDLSRLFVDACLAKGNSFRPCFGFTRSRGLEEETAALQPCLQSEVLLIKSPRGFRLNMLANRTVLSVLDEALLNSALFTSHSEMDLAECQSREFGPDEEACQLWQPKMRESEAAAIERWPVLTSYLTVLNAPASTEDELAAHRRIRLRSIVSLCDALWGDLKRHASATTTPQQQQESMDESLVEMNIRLMMVGDENVQQKQPSLWLKDVTLQEVARKQSVSRWIRRECLDWLKHHLQRFGVFALVNQSRVTGELASSVRQGLAVPFTRVEIGRIPGDHVYQAIFYCLCAGQITMACRLAMAYSMPALASVLSQASAGDPLVRRLMKGQLQFWLESETLMRVPVPLLKVYALLAGIISLPLDMPDEETGQSTQFLHIMMDLPWMATLGVFIWYMGEWQQSLAECLDAYSQAWHQTAEEHTLITPPLPMNSRETVQFAVCGQRAHRLFQDPKLLKSKLWPRDVCYHLLQVYCSPDQHKLSRTLDPLGMFGAEQGDDHDLNELGSLLNNIGLDDWAPTWHLWRVLASLKITAPMDPVFVTRVHAEFATQLEASGLWEWALFVQSHERSALSRSCAIKAMLMRHAVLVQPHPDARHAVMHLQSGQVALDPPPLLTEAEEFIVNQVRIPVRWLHQAKALLAHNSLPSVATNPSPLSLCESFAMKDYEADSGLDEEENVDQAKSQLLATLEATHWFHSGQTSTAHLTCLLRILPQVVIHSSSSAYFENKSGTVAAPGPGLLLAPGMSLRLAELDSLGVLLSKILEPFAELPISMMPRNFREGAGIYLAFAAILRLTCGLTKLAMRKQQQQNNMLEEVHETTMDQSTPEDDEMASLSALRLELGKMCDRLQIMWTPYLISKVVKTEMALISTRLLTTFVMDSMHACEEEQAVDPMILQLTLDALHQMLRIIIEVGLPEDFRCRESRSLTALQISLEAFSSTA